MGRIRTALFTAILLLFLTISSFAQTVLSSTEVTIDGKKYKIDVVLTPVTPPAPTPPATPQDLAATALSPTEVKLTWKDVSTDEGAFVFYRKTGTAAFARIGDSSPNTTTWTDKTAQPGVTYQYQMLAWNPGGGASRGSNIVTVTTPVPPPQPPAAPSNLTATAVSSVQINLTWKDNSTDETEFGIYRKSGNGDWARVSGALANVTTFQDKTAVAGTAYVYRVQAVKDTLVSTWSNEVLVTTPLPTPTPPSAPSAINSFALSPTAISVNWNDLNADETGYEIWRNVGDAGTFVKVGTVGTDVTTYTDATVKGETSYHYKVRAVKGAMFSPYSLTDGWTTPREYPTPPAVLSDGSIYGAVDAGGEAVRDGTKNEVIKFLGTNLGTVKGTATVADLPTTVVSWSDTAVELALPNVPSWTLGKVVVTPPNRKPITSLFRFAIGTGVGSPQEPETVLWRGAYIDAYSDLLGNQLKTFRVGQKIMITGYHFGKSGRFFLEGWEIPTVSWSDQQIVVQLPNSPNMYHDRWITVGNPPSSYYTTGTDWRILPAE